MSEDLHTFNVGEVVRAISDVVLTGPDGSRSTHNATPLVMQAVLLQLSIVTDVVGTLLDEIKLHDLGGQQDRIRSELEAWTERLDTYHGHVNQCVADGKLLDWECSYWCATSPVIIGWYPNSDCSGVAPAQKVQRPPDLATPLSLMNQTLALGAFLDTQGFLTLMTDMLRAAIAAMGEAMTAVQEEMVAAATEVIENAMNSPEGQYVKSRWGLYVMGAVAVVGVGAYLYVK